MKTQTAWRNVMVAAINAGLGQGVLTMATMAAVVPAAQAATIQTTCGPIVLSCDRVGPNPAGIWVYNYSDRERECVSRHLIGSARSGDDFVARCQRRRDGARR